MLFTLDLIIGNLFFSLAINKKGKIQLSFFHKIFIFTHAFKSLVRKKELKRKDYKQKIFSHQSGNCLL